MNLVKLSLTILRIILLSKRTSSLYKSNKSRKKITIVSNGPSINKDQERVLQSRIESDIMMVNLAPSTPLYQLLKPDYLVIAAPEFWLDDVDDWYKNTSAKFFDDIKTKTTWSLVFLIPIAAKKHHKWQEKLSKNKNIDIRFYNNTPIEGFNSTCHALFDLRLGMPRPHNVLIPSLMCSIWLNYSNIELYGVDHSWLPQITVNTENIVLVNQKHFYDENDSKPRHMRKMGRGQRKLHEVMHKFMLTFEGYHTIESYARSKEITIINCTQDSYIDAFQRP